MITPFIFVLELPTRYIHFFAYLLSFNTSSSKLWQPITTTFCVPYTSTWKHDTSLLWMNTSDLIFWLFCIHNLSKVTILIPHQSPCTYFVGYANKSVDNINTFVDCINIFANCVNKSTNYAHTYYDCANTYVDSTDALDAPTSDFYTSNSFPLQLSFNDLFVI